MACATKILGPSTPPPEKGDGPLFSGKRAGQISIILSATLLFSILTMSSSCVSIPGKAYVVNDRGEGVAVVQQAECRDDRREFTPAGGTHREGIDPGGFTLLNWNVMKGGAEGWEADFSRLTADADLLTLQEASLTGTLEKLLSEGSHHWDLAAAFLKNSRETGVLTGSTSLPASLCITRFAEPLAVIPKTVMVSRYPLAGTSRFLLVANVHLINFTIDTGEYRRQLSDLERFLVAHDGPLLLTGDFNTWSAGRVEVVAGLISRLGLEKVEFPEEDLASFFGRTVDHVFYRGLEPVDARAVRVSTSDHNPVLVKFRIAPHAGA